MNILFAKRNTLIVISLFSLSITCAVILFFSSGKTFNAEPSYWPALTMIYEIDGPIHNGITIRETHRLEYNSASNWIDTVIASDQIESNAFGTMTTVGSYTRRNGKQFKTYDSITNDISVDQITDSIVIPNQFLGPLLIFEEGADIEANPPITSTGKTLSEVSTTSRICYQSECEDNATGLTFDRGYGGQWIVLDDTRWGIPLKAGDVFIVKELTLGVSKISKN